MDETRLMDIEIKPITLKAIQEIELTHSTHSTSCTIHRVQRVSANGGRSYSYAATYHSYSHIKPKTTRRLVRLLTVRGDKPIDVDAYAGINGWSALTLVYSIEANYRELP